MRDPARIDRMCDLLRQLWHRNPDQRMGQLIENVTRGDAQGPGHRLLILRNTEDDTAERKLAVAVEGGFEAAWRMK